MSVDLSKLAVKATYGGPDDEYEDGFYFSQSQHVISDAEKFYVSMMLNRNFRILIRSDKSVVDPDFTFDVSLAAGMCFRNETELLVVDNNDKKVVICDRETGDYKSDFITGLGTPNSVAIDKNGNVFVGIVSDDPGVKMFSPDGTEVKVVTKECANYVTYDHISNRIIVSDSDNGNVHLFGIEDGKLQFTIKASCPQGTAVDKDGNIFVCQSDMTDSLVKVYDKDGKFKANLGGDVEDLFKAPLDVFINQENEVVVVDGSVFSGWSRLQTFQL